jgi:hypothetical protein
MLQTFDGSIPADRFIKERLSLVELGFRNRGVEVASHNDKLPQRIMEALRFEAGRAPHIAVPANQVAAQVKQVNAAMNTGLELAVVELNTRLQQAGCDLHYHNGFIQVASDPKVVQEVEAPFWQLVANPKWANVDLHIKASTI